MTSDSSDSAEESPDDDDEFLRAIARAPSCPPDATEMSSAGISGLQNQASDRGRSWSPPPEVAEFRLEQRLGSGATADVWLARDTLLDRVVALKIASAAASAEMRARFRIEARAVAKMHHPNLLVVHHVGELDQHPFLVTEFLAGKSLDHLERPVPPAQVISIGTDLARGLAAAHSAGVLHRDIKPANAFLCDDGVAKVLDFGLAKLTDESQGRAEARELGASPVAFDATQAALTSTGWIAGTPLYMAPETWRGETATRPTDVYSLGALLYELLAGQPPCGGQTRGELRRNVLAGEIGDLRAIAPDTPEPLVDLVLHCLSLRPGLRPSAEDLCHALQAMTPSSEGPAVDASDGDPGGNPYRGLLSFGAEHRGLFFGREVETAAVLTEVAGAPFVLVVGPSGAGKSSVVRAGVAPRVLAGALGRGKWRVATMVPGERPLERLAQALSPVLDQGEDEILRQIRLSPSWAAQRIEELGRGDESLSLLICLDQFEEAWTLSGAAERTAFFVVLAAFARVGPPVRTVATLRVDFLAHLEDLGELRALALRAPVMLGPMSPEGLRRAIVEPARRRGVEVEPALADALVETARGAAGMLPLLEFALGVLWEGRDDATKPITAAGLQALGGLQGALAGHADAALDRLAPQLKADAKRILLMLVTVDGTRARREERDIVGTSASARAALEALLDARLVVASAGEETTAYELAHEVLVSGWPTLRQWLDQEAAARELRERVRRAAAEWERLGRGATLLWRVRQLRDLDVSGALEGAGELARHFTEASRGALRRARRLRLGLAFGVPLLLVLVGAVVWGVSYARHRAAVASDLAAARAGSAKAEDTGRAANEARADAFSKFEKDDLEPAEERWKQTLVLEEETDRERRGVGEALDRALALDPRNGAARALYAEVTLQRLLAAERLRKDALLRELRARLDVYDDGSRAAALRAPAHVRIETEPQGAILTLVRYRESATRELQETDVAPVAAGSESELEAGSYLIVAQAPGRYSTRYPFLARRGEELSLRVILPRAADVPEGMIYVPAGRTLYGSNDDEATRRGFLRHQPMHDAEVAAFLIARTEVTNAEYLEFLDALPETERMGRLPYGLTGMSDGRFAWKLRDRILAPGQPYCNGVEPCVDWSRLPVNGTSREDRERFVGWLSRSGILPGARLCADREWERAARGADDRRYPTGNGNVGPEDACTLAIYAGDALRAGPCASGTHPGSRSPFGVDDLTGSEWEWTSTVAKSTEAIVRGAGYYDSDQYLAISLRAHNDARSRYNGHGLRVCSDTR